MSMYKAQKIKMYEIEINKEIMLHNTTSIKIEISHMGVMGVFFFFALN